MKAQNDFGRAVILGFSLGIHIFGNPPKLGGGQLETQLWSQILPPLWIPLKFIFISVIALCSVLLHSGL